MKKDNLKLGIVGHGFVGKATDNGFHKNVIKFIVDPKINTNIDDLSKFEPDLVFICVPTPMNQDGRQDSRILEKVFKELVKKCPNAIRVVKSTVIPDILQKLKKLDPYVIYNPEFLREKHANKDFINSEMIIFGGEKNTAKKVSEIYLNHSKCLVGEHLLTDLVSASLIKFSINTFLATKVIFFNQLHSLFEKLDVKDSWEDIISIIGTDKRIGKSHMNVPGHDGRKGFGGACFPKDTLALIKYADELGTDLSTLKTIVKENNKIRSNYNSLDARETEQNVSFDDKI